MGCSSRKEEQTAHLKNQARHLLEDASPHQPELSFPTKLPIVRETNYNRQKVEYDSQKCRWLSLKEYFKIATVNDIYPNFCTCSTNTNTHKLYYVHRVCFVKHTKKWQIVVAHANYFTNAMPSTFWIAWLVLECLG